MRYDMRRLAKLSAIFLGLLFLLLLLLGRREKQETTSAPEGEKITAEDVAILLDALDGTLSLPQGGAEETETASGETADKAVTSPYFTYGQYEALCAQLAGTGVVLPDFSDRYESAHGLLKEDWYEAFRILLAHLDRESSVWETTIFLLKVDEKKKEAYTETGAMQGAFSYRSAAFADNVFQEMKVYVKNDVLLTIVEVLPEDHYLGSVWVMEVTGKRLDCFYGQIPFWAEASEEVFQLPEREQIADLTFRAGKLVRVEEQREKVHGRLLRLSETELEIEGQGIYEIAENAAFYKLYGNLASLSQADLRVGCADTDFVLRKGKVCAGLVSKQEEADRIRVLLRNTAAGSDFHDTVALTVDGERTVLRKKDMKIGERRTYRSENLTDKVLLELTGSTREDTAYRGSIECLRMEEGIVVINELPLEEYLYSVVPSEMPASYPAEALKAQAVCARTYACRYILHAGLPAFGAHVDDTTAYQVYHNIAEHANTTTAVKETDGLLLTYQGEPAENYYFSTSCGADPEDETLRAEEAFRTFIETSHAEDIEREEPWYRWTYSVEELDEALLFTRLQERYRAAPSMILTRTAGGNFASEPIEKTGRIKQLLVAERGDGGIAQTLVIETEKAVYRVISEYNIRYVLCDGESPVRRQDGSESVQRNLVPSAYFVMDTVMETGNGGESVVGYTLTGGGFGHGKGMAQNGAKALGRQGASCGEILAAYYPGCTVRNAADLNRE
ncbi:MAG: SpoIID/LytB domain-containing protein [Bacteroidales bacterium]|nr:SpoIID/LytB domain-containing protein [Bacteroidales bacterium]MCM1414389.1 SpoIID/LytB domain-containing protein [bacterium]MCM1422269.1 SpoIID/LytB domain-containing protein [bacterium]